MKINDIDPPKMILNVQADGVCQFYDSDENQCGILRWGEGKFSFEGDCDSSAKSFFEALEKIIGMYKAA